MDLEIIILSEVSQEKKHKCHMTQMPYDTNAIWNLKYNTNQHIYETKTDTQIERTDLWLPRGERG